MLSANVHVNGLSATMANDAVPSQLPIMVRRPRAVWPGLDRMDLHRRQIAGDGNCLFASLADQLYGNPEKHLEIRAAIIDHMRTYRPLFESFAIKDDIQQKRATRAATNAIRNAISDDPFEDYLAIMCKSGTYGGEPELTAFVQCYDQDVLVHLPRMTGYPESIPYHNQYRAEGAEAKPQLHLCYGGDEISYPHYDSARKNTPTPEEVSLTERPKKLQSFTPDLEGAAAGKPMTPRAIRNSRSDLSRDLMHDMIIKGSKDLRASFDDTDRARSPSVSSSHHSSSSKRSFEDEGEPQRATKRADRRKSTRVRGRIDHNTLMQPKNFKLKLSTYSQPATPQSTQSSDYSSDQSDQGTDFDLKSSQEPETFAGVTETSAAPGSTRQSTPVIKQDVSAESVSEPTTTEEHRSSLQA